MTTPHPRHRPGPPLVRLALLCPVLLLCVGCGPTPTRPAEPTPTIPTRAFRADEWERVKAELGRRELGRLFMTTTHPTGRFSTEKPLVWDVRADGRLSGKVSVRWEGVSGADYETTYAFALGGGPADVAVPADNAQFPVSAQALASARKKLQAIADKLAETGPPLPSGSPAPSTPATGQSGVDPKQLAEINEAFNNVQATRIMMASLECHDGKYDEAIRQFDDILRLSPKEAYALNGRGYAHALKGDLAKAFADLDESVRLRPDWAATYRLRGQILCRRKEYRAAASEFGHAIRLDPRADGAVFGLAPEEATAHLERGVVRLTLGDVKGAMEDLNSEVELNPGCPQGYSARAVAWDKVALSSMADKDREKAKQLEAARKKKKP